jgi:hypothetical protein
MLQVFQNKKRTMAEIISFGEGMDAMFNLIDNKFKKQ